MAKAKVVGWTLAGLVAVLLFFVFCVVAIEFILGPQKQFYGDRFLANTPNDPALLEALEEKELIGTDGRVSVQNGAALFEPA